MALRLTGRLPEGAGATVTIADGVISAIESVAVGDDAAWILPGLVDLQINGYGGFDVNGADVNPASVLAMAQALAREGTTAFVPTVITASREAIAHSLDAIAQACRDSTEVAAAIPWIHLEGPYISAEDGPRGAHEARWVRPPSLDELDDWQRAAEGRVGMITISPHHEGSIEFIKGAVARGIRVSLGHTHATSGEMAAAVDAGARFSTHLGNGIQAVLPRHPNLMWTQLADDRLTAGFIADGHHLPLPALKAMIRAKGVSRSFVVSDSVSLAGAEPGTYATPVGGAVELHPDGRLNVAGKPYLAGAALSLRWAIPTLLRTGFTVAEAVDLAATNPGRIAVRQAAVRVGAPADLVVFDEAADQWSPAEVYVRGVQVPRE